MLSSLSLPTSPPSAGRTGVPPQQENVTLDTGQVGLGQRAGQAVPPGVFWRSRLVMEEPNFLKFNISIQKNALIGVYGRKGLPPTHTQVSWHLHNTKAAQKLNTYFIMQTQIANPTNYYAK